MRGSCRLLNRIVGHSEVANRCDAELFAVGRTSFQPFLLVAVSERPELVGQLESRRRRLKSDRTLREGAVVTPARLHEDDSGMLAFPFWILIPQLHKDVFGKLASPL